VALLNATAHAATLSTELDFGVRIGAPAHLLPGSRVQT
jgi:hypothetical protein